MHNTSRILVVELDGGRTFGGFQLFDVFHVGKRYLTVKHYELVSVSFS